MSVTKPSKPHDFGFYIWILQVVIIVSLITVVVWLCFHTNTPNFTVIGFDLPAAEAQNSTSPPMAKNITLVIKFQISNPNRGMGVHYDDMNITLHRGNEVVGMSSVPAFYQGHKKIAQREVSVNGGETFWKAYSRIVAAGEKLNVSVGLIYGFRYRLFGLKLRYHSIDLQANVTVGSDGKLLDGMSVKMNQTSSYI